ncbi:MAG: hypothetical protein A2W07_08505 [candidate division Zixibacteria bacterium RBG_16_43_9]|nr:MAG: hypothetical protein A2W07_08505 [candidate division Zixibacteria bacterium RBG_16_43_9]
MRRIRDFYKGLQVFQRKKWKAEAFRCVLSLFPEKSYGRLKPSATKEGQPGLPDKLSRVACATRPTPD